jgi:hypothetical protein
MKSETALYHCPGYAPRAYACAPGETPGTLNLLDDSGEVCVSGVPVYEDPAKVEKLPNGYCTWPVEAGGRKSEVGGRKSEGRSRKSEMVEAPVPEILGEATKEPEAGI